VKSADIVIPVYNEESVLASSVERLRDWAAEHLPYRWRIVIADNASSDHTLEVARGLAADDPDGVEVLHLDRKGRGRALKKAWLESTADAMCYMDVDLSTDLEDVRPLLGAVLDEGYDLAYGSRLARRAEIERSLRREVNSRGYNALIRLLFWTKFSDAQCGFKAITREAAQRLLPHVRDPEWFFEPKWDGVRAIAIVHREGAERSVLLQSRNLREYDNRSFIFADGDALEAEGLLLT